MFRISNDVNFKAFIVIAMVASAQDAENDFIHFCEFRKFTGNRWPLWFMHPMSSVLPITILCCVLCAVSLNFKSILVNLHFILKLMKKNTLLWTVRAVHSQIKFKLNNGKWNGVRVRPLEFHKRNKQWNKMKS